MPSRRPLPLRHAALAAVACVVLHGCSSTAARRDPLQEATGLPAETVAIWDDVRDGTHAVAVDLDTGADSIDAPVWKHCFPTDRGMLYGHVTKSAGQTGLPATGLPRPPATRRSRRYGSALSRAERLDSRGEYTAAARLLGDIQAKEPNNPFVIEAYARTLAGVGRRASALEQYRKLVTLLDSVGRAIAPDRLYVDAWFVDAYTRFATLSMEAKDWNTAVCELGRVLKTSARGAPMQRTLENLTVASAKAGNAELARVYAAETLRLFPEDTAVGSYVVEAAPDSSEPETPEAANPEKEPADRPLPDAAPSSPAAPPPVPDADPGSDTGPTDI